MLDGPLNKNTPPDGLILPVEGQQLEISRGGRQLLDKVDIRFDGGALTAILGPNGAGKSLLLRVLTGLLPPDSGQVTWAGSAPDRTRIGHMGLVFQKPVLLRRSALANIRYVLHANGVSRSLSRQIAQAALDAASLGYLSQSPARSLSGGEQQRLALVRALSTNPEILLLDEPTASLDPTATGAIEDLVRGYRANGHKVVLVTHDIGQARRLADDVIFMSAGRIVEQAPAQDFFDTPQSTQAKAFLAGQLLL